MIDTLWIFASRNLSKRPGRVLGTTHPYLSGLIALWIVFLTDYSVKASTLVSFFAPYNTVVFGFTATAIALSIALPSERFVRFLSKFKNGSTPFKDFLFILVWNGFMHVLAFFLLIPMAFASDTWTIKFNEATGLSSGYLFIFLWIQLYACFQFLVTTFGVYELADLYANFCARDGNDEDAAR